jgi:hypothetical protein
VPEKPFTLWLRSEAYPVARVGVGCPVTCSCVDGLASAT